MIETYFMVPQGVYDFEILEIFRDKDIIDQHRIFKVLSQDKCHDAELDYLNRRAMDTDSFSRLELSEKGFWTSAISLIPWQLQGKTYIDDMFNHDFQVTTSEVHRASKILGFACNTLCRVPFRIAHKPGSYLNNPQVFKPNPVYQVTSSQCHRLPYRDIVGRALRFLSLISFGAVHSIGYLGTLNADFM